MARPPVLVDTHTGDLLVLEIANGRQRWRYRTDGTTRSTPVLVGDALVFGSRDGTIYAIEAKEVAATTRETPG